MKEETRKLLQKAERAVHAAQTLLREGDVDFAVGRDRSTPSVRNRAR